MNTTRAVDEFSIEFERDIEETFATIIAAAEKRKHQLLEEGKAKVVAKKSRLQIQREGLEKLCLAMKLALDTVNDGIQF